MKALKVRVDASLHAYTSNCTTALRRDPDVWRAAASICASMSLGSTKISPFL